MLRYLGIKARYARFIDMMVLGPLAILGLIQIGLQFDYRIPVTVHYRVIKDWKVPAGGVFIYENRFTRNRYCDTLVERWFVDSDRVRRDIDPLPSSMPTEGLNIKQTSTAKIDVPKVMTPGPAKSCFQSHWQCTWVQKFWPINGPETCISFFIEPTLSYMPTSSLSQVAIVNEGEP